MVVVKDPAGTQLKIDLVNDIGPRVGRATRRPPLGRVDSWRNILSNKVSALFRFEPKDMADLWAIALNKSFSWREAVEQAKKKEGGVDPLLVNEIVSTFPVERFADVKWASPPDATTAREQIRIIADDILAGRRNTLCPRRRV